jgi:HK97 family phage major capsid protein
VPYSTSLFATIRKARTQMELLGEVPTAWVMHPSDLETVDLQTDSGGRLYLVGSGGDERINALFGDLPRVASSRIPAGTAILADWTQARVYIREDVRLDMDRSGSCSTATR